MKTLLTTVKRLRTRQLGSISTYVFVVILGLAVYGTNVLFAQEHEVNARVFLPVVIANGGGSSLINNNSGDNLVYSPYSVALAFSLAYAGAREQTETEMAQVLHFLPQESHHTAFHVLTVT